MHCSLRCSVNLVSTTESFWHRDAEVQHMICIICMIPLGCKYVRISSLLKIRSTIPSSNDVKMMYLNFISWGSWRKLHPFFVSLQLWKIWLWNFYCDFCRFWMLTWKSYRDRLLIWEGKPFHFHKQSHWMVKNLILEEFFIESGNKK